MFSVVSTLLSSLHSRCNPNSPILVHASTGILYRPSTLHSSQCFEYFFHTHVFRETTVYHVVPCPCSWVLIIRYPFEILSPAFHNFPIFHQYVSVTLLAVRICPVSFAVRSLEAGRSWYLGSHIIRPLFLISLSPLLSSPPLCLIYMLICRLRIPPVSTSSVDHSFH